MRDFGSPASLTSGLDERHLARGALFQQVSQVIGTLVMLVVVTVLGRTLTLSEFGTYGLVVATSNYLIFVQGSVEGSAVKGFAVARDQLERDRVFSSVVVLYLSAGLVAGSVVAGGGWLLVGVLGIPDVLKPDARIAVLILGGVIFLGWPLRAFQDLLRGSQRFVDAALAEVAGLAIFGSGMVAIAASRMPLWLLMGMGGCLPAVTGLASLVTASRRRMTIRFRLNAVETKSLLELAGLSGYLLIGGASALVIFALDRVLLAAFRGASTVGLYEGPVRIHNFISTVQTTLAGTVLPAASFYHAQKDEKRLSDLMLRGTRYVLVVTLPITTTLMVLAKPLLELWLGRRFGVAGNATTILLAYWLVALNQSVAGSMLIAGGYARWLARYGWTIAAANLVGSAFLTWQYGLNGVVLGTTIPFVVAFPAFLRKSISALPFTIRGLLESAWVPAYSTAAIVASCLVVIRFLVRIDNLGELIGFLLGGPLLYWIIFYAIWTTPGERALIRDLARSVLTRLRNPFQRPHFGPEA